MMAQEIELVELYRNWMRREAEKPRW